MSEPQPPLWIICVHTDKGGAGKTTLVVNLADSWSRILPNYNILVIDVDPQCNSSCRLLGRPRGVKRERDGEGRGEDEEEEEEWTTAFRAVRAFNDEPEAVIEQQNSVNFRYRPRTVGGWLQLVTKDKQERVEAARFVTRINDPTGRVHNDTFRDNVYLVCGDTRLHRGLLDRCSKLLNDDDEYAHKRMLTNFRTLARTWQVSLADPRPTIVIIDTNASFNCFTRSAITSSDFIVMPYKAELDGAQGVQMCLETIYGDRGSTEGCIARQCQSLDIRPPKVLAIVFNEAIACYGRDLSHRVRRERCIHVARAMMEKLLAAFRRDAPPDAFVSDKPQVLFPNYGIRATVASYQQCPVSALAWHKEVQEEIRRQRWATMAAHRESSETPNSRAALEVFLDALRDDCRKQRQKRQLAEETKFTWKNDKELPLNQALRDLCKLYNGGMPAKSVKDSVTQRAIEVCRQEKTILSADQMTKKFRDQARDLVQLSLGQEGGHEEDEPVVQTQTNFERQVQADTAATDEAATYLASKMGVLPGDGGDNGDCAPAPAAVTASAVKLFYNGMCFQRSADCRLLEELLPDDWREEIQSIRTEVPVTVRQDIDNWFANPPLRLNRDRLAPPAREALRCVCPAICVFPFVARGCLPVPELAPHEDRWDLYDLILMRQGTSGKFRVLQPDTGEPAEPAPQAPEQPPKPPTSAVPKPKLPAKPAEAASPVGTSKGATTKCEPVLKPHTKKSDQPTQNITPTQKSRKLTHVQEGWFEAPTGSGSSSSSTGQPPQKPDPFSSPIPPIPKKQRREG